MLSRIKSMQSEGHATLSQIKSMQSEGHATLSRRKSTQSEGHAMLPRRKLMQSEGQATLSRRKLMQSEGHAMLSRIKSMQSEGHAMLSRIKLMQSEGHATLSRIILCRPCRTGGRTDTGSVRLSANSVYRPHNIFRTCSVVWYLSGGGRTTNHPSGSRPYMRPIGRVEDSFKPNSHILQYRDVT